MNRFVRSFVAAGAACGVIGALASSPVAAGTDRPSVTAGVARSAAPVALVAGGANGAPSFVGPARSRTDRQQAATFQVTYSGFTPAAQAAFQSAVNVWASKVTTAVPITVKATFTAQPSNLLGSAGSSFIWRDFTGAPRAGTWYVDAIANKRAGRQMDPSPDIVANFNSSRTDWFFGTTGGTPAGKYDFKSVVLHELGHGLGFLGAGRVASGLGTVRNSGFPLSYDHFTENGAGTRLLTFPDNSAQLSTQLRSNSVYFDSTPVRNANGGQPARLYAPTTWQQGSSYSHLNEATYPKGNANSLMTPQLNSAEAIHSPGPITQALFKSIGW
jgi:hypothetical protein